MRIIFRSPIMLRQKERTGQMGKYVRWTGIFVIIILLLTPVTGLAKEKIKEKNKYEIPEHVLTISKENTFPNATADLEVVEPSKQTKELLKQTDTKIENPDLIKLLNETTIKPSPIAIGYRGMVFLGRWPLHYQSEETNVNWQYQQINTNEANNFSGDEDRKLHYNQMKQKEIKGALTNKISHTEDVKKMLLQTAKNKSKLPLSYETVIGKDTKKDHMYTVHVNKIGLLNAYATAVNEKGKVTFGEVYIELKGSKKQIVLKNITKQGVGAWIPIQDHVSFSFQLK